MNRLIPGGKEDIEAEKMISIYNEKLVITAGIFCATMVFGMLPIQLVKYLFANEAAVTVLNEESESPRDTSANRRHRHHRRSSLTAFEARREKRRLRLKKIISYASCFSGGVFIAACLLDLLPDVHEAFDHVLDEIEDAYHTKVDYPVAEFVIVFGFFVVLILEQIVLDCKEGWQEEELGFYRHSPDEHRPLLESPTATSHYGSNVASAESLTQELPSVDDCDSASLRPITFRNDQQHHHQEHSHGADIFNHSALRAVLLIVALTFHSLFEGLAIGLQQEIGELMSIFIAVVIHKAVMAFSLGLNIAQSNFGAFQAISSIFIFSISSPIGIGIGMVLVNMEKSLGGDIANGILQGIAGGTFLYITFFEVLPHELNAPQNRMQKLLFVLSGYICICCLLFITH